MPAFPEAARAALADTQLRHNLAHATTTIRDKRAARGRRGRGLGGPAPGRRGHQGRTRCATSSATWCALEASLHGQRRDRALGARRRRGQRDRRADRAQATTSTRSSRSSRWRPQEIGLNEALEAEGIAAWETDLAELIVQLGEDLPSHILVPAIHRNRAEIREIFLRRMAAAGRPAPDDAHRRAGRAGRGGAAAPAGEVPAGEGRRLGRQLRGRRDRHAGRRRVRGQRPDVPDPAGGAGLASSASRRWCRPGRTSTRCCGCCRAPRPASG